MNKSSIDLLRYFTLKQACQDYYRSCLPPEQLPKRPKREIFLHDEEGNVIYHINKNGEKKPKKIKRLMTDEEYADYLEKLELRRLNLKKDCLDFFHSEWFQTLYPQGKIDVDELLETIEYRRKKGIHLYRKEDCDDMD